MKRTNILVAALVLVVAFAGLSVVGCGKKTAIKGPIEIEFWHAMGKGHSETLQKLADKFHAENPNITVNLVYQGRYGDLSQKIQAALAAKSGLPAMAQVYEDWTSLYIKADAIVPIEDFMTDKAYGLKENEIADIMSVFRTQNTWNGKMYTMPFNKSINVLFYNTDLIPTPPTTWEELKTIAKSVTKDGVYGLGIRPNVDLFGFFLRQAGGEYLDANGKAAFHSEAGVTALQFIVDAVNEGWATIVKGYESDAFGPGQIAMYMGSIAGIPYVEKNSEGIHGWSLAPLPKGVKSASPTMGTNLAIFKGNDEATQEAAWRFIKFLIQPENTLEWALGTGYVPVRESAWADYIAANPMNEQIKAQFADAVFDPHPVGWSGARDLISKAVEAAVLGEKSAADALNEAAAAVDQELAEADD